MAEPVEDRLAMAEQEDGGPKEPPSMLSKRQQKKLAKRQKWLAERPARRAKEKEKRIKRKAEINAASSSVDVKVKRPLTRKTSTSKCRIRVAIDVAYDHLMSESEISKTCKQIQRCYAANRRTVNPLQLYITNYSSQSKDKLVKLGCEQWDVHRKNRSCAECFAKEEIVYLTSESPNVLDKLDDAKAYVIGGLVDHNQHKGLCLSVAEKNGFGHARLPIDEFVLMKTRKVLSIVHVFETLLNVTTGMGWAEALIGSLPKRKLPSLLDEGKDDQKLSDNSDRDKVA